jgi:hypothetical protein
LRKLLFAKNRGSVESFITIIPQVFIFLVMFQLIFMQFDVMKDSNLSQGELAKIAIEGGEGNYNYHPLIGGGSLLFINQMQSNKKVIAVAVNESLNN